MMDERAFTLIELIVVMVLVGILAYAGADLIVSPFMGFQEASSRIELFEEGSIALEKMASEIRIAVPNAISCPDPQTIRFGMIDQETMRQYGVFGIYKNRGDASPVDEYIEDVNASAPAGSLISIYNRRWSPDFELGQRIYRVVDAGPPMQLDSKITSGAYNPKTRRFYVIRDKAVEYSLSGNTIYRKTAPVTSAGVGSFSNPHPLIRHVKSLEMYYSPGNIIRNAVVSITLELQSDQGETVTLHREVHVPNVP